jgi:hypothetical protein
MVAARTTFVASFAFWNPYYVLRGKLLKKMMKKVEEE